MKRAERMKRRWAVIILSALLALLPLQAHAIDGRYLTDSEFWRDTGTVSVLEEDTLQAMVKSVADTDEGTLYLYVNMTDTAVSHLKAEDFVLTVTVRNAQGDYRLHCTAEDYYSDGYADASDFAEVQTNYLVTGSRANGAKLFAAVHLLDSKARTLDNRISCHCFYGTKSYAVLENAVLDLTPVTTVKETRSTTAKVTTTRAAKASTQKSTTAKSGSAAGTTKFTGGIDTYLQETTTAADVTTAVTEVAAEASARRTLHPAAKVTLLLGALLAGAGAVMTLVAALKKEKDAPQEEGEKIDTIIEN